MNSKFKKVVGSYGGTWRSNKGREWESGEPIGWEVAFLDWRAGDSCPVCGASMEEGEDKYGSTLWSCGSCGLFGCGNLYHGQDYLSCEKGSVERALRGRGLD